jgi:hypothetical protein
MFARPFRLERFAFFEGPAGEGRGLIVQLGLRAAYRGPMGGDLGLWRHTGARKGQRPSSWLLKGFGEAGR